MVKRRFLKGHFEYQLARQSHWDKVAASLDTWKGLGNFYHKRLSTLLRHIIPKNRSVLEIGCGEGKLLQSLSPRVGVGIDFSSLMCERAKSLNQDLIIIQADAHNIPLYTTFEFIVISDLLNDLWDAQQFFHQIKKLSNQDTRIIINVYSRLWEIPLAIGQKVKLAKPNLLQNWFTPLDIERLLKLENIEVINISPEIVFPFYIPLITPIINRFVGRFWPFNLFAITNLIVARSLEKDTRSIQEPTVSVVIPARNESGNIESLFQRTPLMGSGTELIFVEGHSKDNTFKTINNLIEDYSNLDVKLYQQTGKGKGDAVRLGFEKAKGDILMILDSDLSVPPENLSRFYDALVNNKGEFINGVRLVYPMEDQAMRFLNIVGNKFFSLAFSWLMNQPIKDTLCGTKVLYKKDYLQIANNRSYFGNFDPFGDFDLLFGASKLNLNIVDLPIRYRSRIYGQTNIQRFKHGFLLFRMLWIAALKLKFI